MCRTIQTKGSLARATLESPIVSFKCRHVPALLRDPTGTVAISRAPEQELADRGMIADLVKGVQVAPCLIDRLAAQISFLGGFRLQRRPDLDHLCCQGAGTIGFGSLNHHVGATSRSCTSPQPGHLTGGQKGLTSAGEAAIMPVRSLPPSRSKASSPCVRQEDVRAGGALRTEGDWNSPGLEAPKTAPEQRKSPARCASQRLR